MKKTNPEDIKKLLLSYQGDTKRALKENKGLERLYALSELRENLLDFYDFKEDASLMQVGADYGVMTTLYERRVKKITVIDPSKEMLELAKLRLSFSKEKRAEVCFQEATLTSYDEKETYDYVVIVGSLQSEETKEAEIFAAKSMLKPDGVLILAVENALGLKTLTGGRRDEVAMTRSEIDTLLPSATYYYPLPDYKIAGEIFSDTYLPSAGDLSGSLTAYDYPQFTSIKLGMTYDKLCENGMFAPLANSFLVIWNKGEASCQK